jgi:hypothetical protein
MGKTNKKSLRKQKIYKMIGCSKTRKNHLGGSTLAYTGQPVFSLPNPHLAYTGKGGASCGLTANTTMPVNTNAANPTVPNTGPVSNGANTIFNNASAQRGGCGCGMPSMTGGGKNTMGGTCSSCSLAGFMVGGTRHRNGCKCSSCKRVGMKGGNAGIPYPNGLVGSSWTPSVGGWPGVDGVPGDSNHYPVNTYNNDISRQMVDLGGNPPFSNVKGGANVKGGRRRKQRGGTLSNFLGQDLINLGRQFQFGMGSAYNALAGYSAPVNPLPWKDQFPSRMSINPATI